ncbi:MAG: ABC transporter related protein [uncultured bacterium]|uniref:ABC transporter related protein n=1 Tax=Candidatus Wolfebacteria bacterium GW2011_GWE2_44_13 TaxID=1619017 RepID=A0A0G1H8D0_9BACT|nr:MAG: ABC transporter related protein [uncultured bacterium]KKT42743.1 MAG: ABC transporter related protein [Candidatus Wolfebacteria bacterium GW2011_GWE2_44_13]
MDILTVRDLTVGKKSSPVIEKLDFSVAQGETLAIIGPNGAGKTTLFKALLGLTPYSGSVTWAPNVKIGYVPQRMEIETDIPLTVEEFFKLHGSVATPEKIREILNYVQLDTPILKSGFGEISVGQRQRILVGWSIMDNPNVLLFDEPTADVDIFGQESIYKMISHLHKTLGLTVILISHDLSIVYQYANNVLCLNHQKLCYGIPDEMLQAEHLQSLYGGERGLYKHDHGNEKAHNHTSS